MKKFLADNITWIVLIALVLSGFAVWKIVKADGGKIVLPKDTTPTDTTVE